ncbi:hypothetical protein Tco_0398514 [Tanacetum coccineum]
MIRMRAEAASTSHSLPLPPPFILSPTRPDAPSLGIPPPLPISVPTSSPPLLLPFASRREDRPEVTLPPQKRLGIALVPGYEVGESSSAAAIPAGGLRADYSFVATMDMEIKRDLEREIRYGITDLWDEIVETLQGAPVSTDTELGRHMTAFETRVRQDMDEFIHIDRRDKMETKARLSREAWRRSMDASDLARREVMSLCTTILGQMSEIRELHDADRRKQAVTLEMLKADHRRSAEMRELRTTDCTRQQQLIQTLTIMQSLQREVTPLLGQVTTSQGQVTALQGQVVALHRQMSLNNDLRGPNRLHNWYQSLVALDLGSTRLKEQQMAFVFTAAVKRLNEYRELTVGMVLKVTANGVEDSTTCLRLLLFGIEFCARHKTQVWENFTCFTNSLYLASYSLLLPPPFILSPTRSNAPSLGIPPPLPTSVPTSSPPLLLPSASRREDRLKVTLPPRKRLGIAFGPRYEVGESSSVAAARLARGLRADFGFVATMDRDIRRDPEKEVGYGITDSWDEIVETLQGASVSTDKELGQHMTTFKTRVRQDTDEIYTRLDDEQSQRQLLAGRLNMLFRDRRAQAYTRHQMETEARFSREAWR